MGQSMTTTPRLIDWALTARCNLSCRHCRGMVAGEVDTARARTLIDEVARLKPGWVIVEGGEPLLRPDIFELLGLLRAKDLEAHLITNSMLLTPAIIARLKELGTKVMISIDGATAATYETIRAGARFETAVAQARACARAGLLEAINFTVLKTNYHEIPALFDLAASIGVRQITFIGLKPCHGYQAELLAPDEYRQAIRAACEGAQRTGVGFFFDEPFFRAVIREGGLDARIPAVGAGILVPSVSACIFGEYLFIEPSGDVRPCSFAPMTLGNIKKKSLVDIWQGVLESEFFRRIRAPERGGHCGDCRHLADCLGCRSRSFMLTGDWFAADPACPLSHELSRETR